MTSLVWLRNDLRLEDNPALYSAAADGPVQLVYCVHRRLFRRHSLAPSRINLIKRRLIELSDQCKAHGLPLLVIAVEKTPDLATSLVQLADELSVESIYWNREYPLDERDRDVYVGSKLTQQGISVKTFDDRMFLAPEKLLKSDGSIYRVFTPFKNNYHKLLKSDASSQSLGLSKHQKFQEGLHSEREEIDALFEEFKQVETQGLWPAGQSELNGRLVSFAEQKALSYREARDIPSLDGTSQLSPYLAIGALSPRQVMDSVLRCAQITTLAELISRQDEFGGVITWFNELLWRDFYQYLMFHTDNLSKGLNFQTQTQYVGWRTGKQAEDDFAKWCSGQTGYPIIDAAILQLLDTGWMHNRLRMITAMFLTKHLLIDWRWGEQFFTEHLIDWDFAANNGGWQWSASTGCDAAPYFRIFNPVTQGERFDPDGKFICQYLPQLSSLSKKLKHNPQGAAGYYEPVVDLKLGRQRALDAFKRL